MPGTVWSTGTTQLGRLGKQASLLVETHKYLNKRLLALACFEWLGFRKYVLPQWRYRVQWRRTSEAQPFELCGHVNWDVWSVELWTTHLKHKQVELMVELPSGRNNTGI
jgi:hypothetical protein